MNRLNAKFEFTRRDLARLIAVSGAAAANGNAASEPREWSVTAAGCTQKLALVDGHYRCTSLRNAESGQEWLHPDESSDEFLVQIADTEKGSLTLTGKSGWRYVSFEEKRRDRGWHESAITLESDAHPVRVTRHYAAHERLAVIRQWTVVTNTGTRPLRVTRLDMFRLRVGPATRALELRWINNFGRAMIPSPGNPIQSRAIEENTEQLVRTGPYSPDCAWFSLGVPDSGELLAGGWEWSGDMAVGFGGGLAPCLIYGGLDPARMSEPLAPGARMVSPAGWYGFAGGGADGAAALSHALVRDALGPALPAKDFPWVAYDTWSASLDKERNPANEPGRDPWFPTEKNVLGQLEAAAAIGCELFLWDYGWFPRVGDWWFDPERFPKGPQSVTRAVHNRGMKLGLWFGFGNAMRESRVVREHPDWLAEYNGKPIPDDFFIRTAASTWNTRILCLGHRPAREWVKEQLARVIDQSEIDWLKHDFDLITTCQARHHTHTEGDGRLAACEAFYDIMDFVRTRYPHIVCEHWMNDSATPDYGVVQRHHVQLIGDAYDAFRLRQMVYGHLQVFPLDRQQRYLRLEDSKGELTTMLQSSMLGGPWTLLSDPRLLDNAQRKRLASEIGLYKRFRHLFASGRVDRLIGRPHPRGWDALQLWDERAGDGALYVFRDRHPDAGCSVRLRGLQRAPEYQAEFIRAGTTARFTGAKLIDEGVRVELAQPDTCELIALRRLTGKA
ncbi:MAG TPA: alpha-galactosidase [Bryobacteraceae bacterium]